MIYEDILLIQKNEEENYTIKCVNIQEFFEKNANDDVYCTFNELKNIFQYFYNKGYEEGKKSRSFVTTQPAVYGVDYATSNSK